MQTMLILGEELAGLRINWRDEFTGSDKVADRQVDGDDLVGPDLDGQHGLLVFLTVVHSSLPSFTPKRALPLPPAVKTVIDTWAALQKALRGRFSPATIL